MYSKRYADVEEFYTICYNFLEEHEAENNLIFGILETLRTNIYAYDPTQAPELVAIFDNKDIVLVSIRTPPYNQIISYTKEKDSIPVLVEFLAETGVEIPAIPFQFSKIKALIRYLEKIGAKFLNLNEFEITESNAKYLKMFGYSLKENTIAAVHGSEKFALKILNWARPLNLNIHYCPIGYKDGIQLKKRYLRRAKNIALPYEIISDEGLLVKGIIFKENVKINDLERFRALIIHQFRLDESLITINHELKRLEISIKYLKKIKKELKKRNFIAGIIEELPLSGKNRIQMTFTPI